MDELAGRSLDWINGAVHMVDQTRLPTDYEVLVVDTAEDMTAAIKRLSIRGAPGIGVAGAYGVALAVRQYGGDPNRLSAAISSLRTARPTAVNLARMVDRAATIIDHGFDAVLQEAHTIRREEIDASFSMGQYGADLFQDLIERPDLRVMTICNTGALAAVERGTALAVIQTLHERGVLREALPVETRPLLQGSRLTAWELDRMGAPHRLLVDSAGPFMLARGAADIVVTGADRVAANGDTANKIGTFSLALGARYAGVPFVVVAPESTVDMGTPTGSSIEIEDRGAAEIITVRGVQTAPRRTQAMNPAFDITPVDLITALVTDRRVVRFDRGQTLASVKPGSLRR
jgi:methylthioribose-1-phosphate isomerase